MPIDIPHLRLYHQRIAANPFAQAAEAVQWLGAVQAQDFAGAKWALGLRTQNATDEIVERAFDEGAILRTHLLRPTWHFVAPTDIHWLLELTAPRVHALNAPYYRKVGLDDELHRRVVGLLSEALHGGQQLTRDELRVVLDRAGIATAGAFRLVYLLMRAELDGVICSGARRGNQFTYTLLDERVAAPRRLARDEALAELARRYFVSRGPATLHDFAKWSGLTVADARAGLETVKSELQHEQLDGQTYWLAPTAAVPNSSAPVVYLLSIFDEYVSGYKERGAIIEPSYGEQLRAMDNDLTAIVVLDGQVIGTWKRTQNKNSVVVATNLFRALSEGERHALGVAVERYGAFLQLPATLSDGAAGK